MMFKEKMQRLKECSIAFLAFLAGFITNNVI